MRQVPSARLNAPRVHRVNAYYVHNVNVNKGNTVPTGLVNGAPCPELVGREGVRGREKLLPAGRTALIEL